MCLSLPSYCQRWNDVCIYKDKGVSEVTGRNQVVQIAQQGDGMGAILAVTCHSTSHESLHSRFQSEVEERV